MKISIDVQSLLHERTGIGQYTYHCIHALQEIDKKNTYSLTFFSLKKGNIEGLRTTENFVLNNKRISGRVLEKLWKTFNRPWYDSLGGSADVFHFPNFIIHPVKKGRTIATIHDLSFKRFPHFTEPKNLVYLNKCIDRTLHRADHIIADSAYTREQIIEDYHYPEENITVAYLGVAGHFMPVIDDEIYTYARKKYGLPDYYIFYCGTIEPRKNLGTLFKAFSQLKKKPQFRELKLVLTGMKGWLLDEVYNPLRENGIEKEVYFTGYVPDQDLPVLFSMASLFVFPSYYEGFGLPPLEAMACNVPVIASQAPSLPEVLGDGALYFDPDSPEELENAMQQVLTYDNIKHYLVEKGKKQVAKYSWKITAQTLLDVYTGNVMGR